MAVSLVGTPTTAASTTQVASLVIAKPSGVAVGDLLVATVSSEAANPLYITAPTGWTRYAWYDSASGIYLNVFSKVATDSEPTSYTFGRTNGTGRTAGGIIALRGVDIAAPVEIDAATTYTSNVDLFTAPAVAAASDAYVLRILSGYALTHSNGVTGVPAGYSRRYRAQDPGWVAVECYTHAVASTDAAASFDIHSNAGADISAKGVAVTLALVNGNTAPNAPTLTSMHDGSVVDRNAANRASHAFSDPDAGDSQSAFDHRYRLVGSSTWTEAYVASPNMFHDYPAGTFAAGDYERQVRTYDAQGVGGPWSASGFFSAADGPAEPTITDPIQNDTIAAETRDVTWSAPQQDAYQLQVLDGGLVEHDTGTVVSTSRTAYGVPFPTNNVSRSIRVRVRSSGLWSSWYTIAVSVSYTRPPTPSFTLTAAGTAIVVQVANPVPGAGEPAVVQNDVFVTEDGTEQRRAVVTPNGSWTYWLPKAGLDYAPLVRVEAIGDNGTRSSS